MKRALITLLAVIGVNEHLSAQQKQDIADAAWQAAPSAGAAAGSRAMGLPLSDWLVLASIAFVLLQAGHLVWKWRRDSRRERERQEDRRAGLPDATVCETDRADL